MSRHRPKYILGFDLKSRGLEGNTTFETAQVPTGRWFELQTEHLGQLLLHIVVSYK